MALYEYRASLQKVVDGDTLDLSIDLGMHVYSRQRVRLLHVDTPERGQVGSAEATQAVKDWFTTHGTNVVIRTYLDKGDKYGRFLAEVFPHDGSECLGEWLLLHKFGSPYEGGPRTKETD